MTYTIYTTTEEYNEGDPGPLPVRDVQVIVQDHPSVGAHLVTSGDYYVLRDGRWIPVDIFGLFDYLMDTGLVLFGRTISNKEYQAIYQKAKAKKAGWLPRERKP